MRIAGSASQSEPTWERILAALREARVQLERAKAAQLEPVAVVGMGCRFPGSGETPESFWNDLCGGVDAVRKITPDRWDIEKYYDSNADAPGKMYVREAALLGRVDEFDAAFFGISPREAGSMDPQQRLLLEVCWEALENAAIAPDGLARTRTGVFLGIGQNDYARLATGPGCEASIGAYDGTGNGFCFASGRISYVLGLQGPNLAVDTACSSGLVAVHLAVQSLRRRESDCALAAAVQLILSPEATLFLSRTKALAPDGRSKPFDASADGYGRGEGCGVVVLKRLADARRDGDRIVAVIAGSAVNHDGPGSGLTVPNPLAQEALLREALSNAGVRPDEVGYVETHGTGTILGDPLELRALGAVFGGKRNSPLRLGSVKANIGHLEAAAGMAGLIKTILVLRNAEIPPCLHLHEPNPRIPWNELPFEVPTSRVPWGRGEPRDARRIAGVSSFSLSGTNAHVVVEAPSGADANVAGEAVGFGAEAQLLTISARTDKALRALAVRLRDYLEDNPGVRLADLCGTLGVGRAHHAFRWAAVVTSVGEAKESLELCASPEREGTAVSPATGTGNSAVFSFPNEAWHLWGVDPAEPLSRGAIRIGADPATADRSRILEALAQLYCHGFPIRWGAVYAGRLKMRLELPTYPFERQRFWLPAAVPESRSGNPLLRRKTSSPLIRQTILEGSLSAASQPYLADHRIFGDIVVPGACHISMLLGAALEMFGSEAVELRDVVFPAALVIGENETAELQLVLEPGDDGSSGFTLISVGKGSWSTHAQGTMAVAMRSDQGTSEQAEGLREYDPAELYRSLGLRGIGLGPAFRWMASAGSDNMTATCRMQTPDSLKDSRPDYPLHPGLIDSCFQLLGAAITEDEGTDTYIPFRIDCVRFAAVPDGGLGLRCTARLRDSAGTAARTGDIWLANEMHSVLEVRGLEVRKHTDRPAPLYELVWRKVAEPESHLAARPGVWLILADRGGIADGLAYRLRSEGNRVALVREGSRYLRLGEDEFEVTAGAPEFGHLFLGDLRGGRYQGIAHLWSLDAVEIGSALDSIRGSVPGLIRELAHAPGRFLAVTRGAQQVEAEPGNPLQSMPWGLHSVLRAEHPEWSAAIIDLDPNYGTDPDWMEILRLSAQEDRLAVRGGAFLTPRLAPCPVQAGVAPAIRDGRCYLITGGMGALGLRTAHWLRAQGAAHLVLCGRSAPSTEAQAAIEALRSGGTEVLVARADISRPEDVDRLFALMEGTLPPPGGIVHAAGVLEDGLLAAQPFSAFRRVLEPKALGAWNLHRKTKDLNLDFFVCFSSVASVLASPGQGAYAAANAFLDGLMRCRRAAGLAGLSIGWGPWGETGMAAGSAAKIRAFRETGGLEFLPPAAALKMLGMALAQHRPYLAAFDLRRMAAHLSATALPSILAELKPARAAPARAAGNERRVDLGDAIRTAEPADRPELLRRYLREQAGRVLGHVGHLTDNGESLTMLGVDSLMAVEMRSIIAGELGRDIPIVRFLDGSGIQELAALLASQFTGGDREESKPEYAMAAAAGGWVEGEL